MFTPNLPNSYSAKLFIGMLYLSDLKKRVSKKFHKPKSINEDRLFIGSKKNSML